METTEDTASQQHQNSRVNQKQQKRLIFFTPAQNVENQKMLKKEGESAN